MIETLFQLSQNAVAVYAPIVVLALVVVLGYAWARR